MSDNSGSDNDRVPAWSNYVPPGKTKDGVAPADDGWPAWANYRPGPRPEPAPKTTVPVQPAESLVADTAAPDPYVCCGKSWNGPRQLTMHRRNKACPNRIAVP